MHDLDIVIAEILILPCFQRREIRRGAGRGMGDYSPLILSLSGEVHSDVLLTVANGKRVDNMCIYVI